MCIIAVIVNAVKAHESTLNTVAVMMIADIWFGAGVHFNSSLSTQTEESWEFNQGGGYGVVLQHAKITLPRGTDAGCRLIADR